MFSICLQKQTASQLEWLKKVNSHFGSTEITSMAQATAINETGIYRVGNIPNFSKDFKVSWLLADWIIVQLGQGKN